MELRACSQFSFVFPPTAVAACDVNHRRRVAACCLGLFRTPQNLGYSEYFLTLGSILWVASSPSNQVLRRRAMSAASCRLPNGLCPGEREELLSQPLKPAPAVPFKSPYDLFRWEQQPLQPPGLSRQDREKRLGELPPYSSSPSPTLHSCHMCRRPALEGTPRDEES